MSTDTTPVGTDRTERPDAERLSTQPAAPGSAGPRLGAAARARRIWRQLTSMRTALLLLAMLALAAVPGSLLPQRANSPSRVQQWFTDHPGWAHFFDRLGLFDTFHAPWFAAIYALLFISLIGCLVPRLRLHARALRRRPPAAPARLSRLPQSATWRTDLPPDQVTAAVARALRRTRFRTYVDGDTVSAEKGYLRETGNLLFHVALVVLLLGIGLGSLFGYQGQVLLLPGKGFTNAVGNFDAYKPGALINAGDLSPFHVHLDSFRAAFRPDGEPASFDAHVTAGATNSQNRRYDLQVNHPLIFGNAKVYLLGHGYAVHVVIRNAAGHAVYDDSVACVPQNLTDYLSSCVIKAPDTGATEPTSYTDRATGRRYTTNADGSPLTRPLQFGVLMNFVPTAAVSPTLGIVSTFPAANRPRAVISAFTGDLKLNTGKPVNVFDLNTQGMTALSIPPAKAVVTPGDHTRVPLAQGFTLEVAGYSQWASLQVKDDPAKGLTLIAAGMIVLGLLGSLRVRRRRVWLRATPDAEGRTLIAVGGLARTDADDFAREFRTLVGRLAQTVPAVPTAASTKEAAPDAR
ncbi:MAG TPA: cytochrome c biogenesis protein ResB [Mycobacteriales bacterium]|nr:cytochrome c biogenesis protein ResB [Mycobacteriales bacterium]